MRSRREVREELGISKVKVLEFLDTTTHGYRDGRKYVVKTSYWWHMSTEETEFIPQAAEKITDVRWFGLNKAKKVLGHETLIWLLNRVEHMLVSGDQCSYSRVRRRGTAVIGEARSAQRRLARAIC